MKVLAVTFFHVPWVSGDQTGIGRRFSVFLRALQQVSDDITLLHLVPPKMIAAAGPIDILSASQSAFWGVKLRIALAPRRARMQTAWNHYGAGIFDVSRQPRWFPYAGADLAAAVGGHLDARPDLVFAFGLHAMLPILRSGRKPARLIYDNIDIEHRVLIRDVFSAPFMPGKPVQLLQAPALIRLERRALAASRVAFVCSEVDRAYLRRLRSGGAVHVVPNALAVPADPPGVVAMPTVLFLGDMQNLPNRRAAERMVERIWPLVLQRSPAARLLVAGRGSDRLRCADGRLASVDFLGFVDDLDALYARSRLVCCPIMTGGGTRLKLVEAASYARPMVSTRMGMEGLDFADGDAALIRDDDAGFAAACSSLLEDDALCARLGGAARRRMQAQYDARRIEDDVAEMLRSLDKAG